MSEIPAADIDENWSLQAIVRGSSGNFTEIVDDIDIDGPDSFLDVIIGNHQQLIMDHEFFATFPEVFEISDFSDELEELYKPFYPVTNSLSTLSTSVIEFQDQKRVKINVDEDDQKQPAADCVAVARSNPPAYTPKYKKRKNQHKRVVMQVSGEGLGSDMWAWRKYGQKPIKGSPYPRSYYRCSSSKVCLARKQVEQSCTDPGMYIITYTEEHNHIQPTRRNSLAGTVRQKFPSPKSPNTNLFIKQEKPDESSISSTTSGGSPQNILQGLDFIQATIEQEKKIDEHEHDHDDVNNDFGKSDLIFKDDFFSGLEDFDEFVSEMYTCNSSARQFPVRYSS